MREAGQERATTTGVAAVIDAYGVVVRGLVAGDFGPEHADVWNELVMAFADGCAEMERRVVVKMVL